MIRTKFYLGNKTAKDTYVFFSASCNGFRVQVSAGFKVKSRYWDSKRRRLKANAPHAVEFNALMDDIENKVISYYTRRQLSSKNVTKDEMKAAIGNIKKPGSKESEKTRSVFEVFDRFIEEKVRDYKESTLKKFKTMLNHLKGFAKTTGYSVTFDGFTEDFATQFRHYLNYDKGLTNTSVNRLVRLLKTFLYYCYDKEIIKDGKFQKALKINGNNSKAESNAVALSKSELNDLQSLILDNPRLEKVRDLFLVQCYTGLRYSDLSNLAPENIDLKNEVIILNTVKTSESLIIPIHSKIKPIMERFAERVPKISNQKYNVYLKELCRLADFNEPIQQVAYVGTKRIQETKKKYELVSSHTGRRTMITLALKSGMLPETVMKISGHRSRASFDKYVRVTQTEALNEFKRKF